MESGGGSGRYYPIENGLVGRQTILSSFPLLQSVGESPNPHPLYAFVKTIGPHYNNKQLPLAGSHS
jgi:hypothetical protein